MNVYVLYYDEFWAQEPILALNKLHDENVLSVALEKRPYTSYEKLNFIPDKIVSELDPDDVDLLLIPGGDAAFLLDDPVIKPFVAELNARNKLIAGICYGAVLMANYGVLVGKKCTGSGFRMTPEHPGWCYFSGAEVMDEDVVVDGNTITAVGTAYMEFASELARVVKESKQ